MLSMSLRTVGFVMSAVLFACGGGDSGEALIKGSLTAEYAGTAFTPEFGFVECAFTAGSEPVLHANAVFQRKFPPHGAIAAMMARQNSTGNQLGDRGSHSL